MRTCPAVLLKLAELYEASAAGRHGEGKLDFQPDFAELMRLAGCAEGESHELAERDLRAAEDAGLITLEYDRPRARTTILKVRFAPEKESAFFDYLRLESPTQCRARWRMLFLEAAEWPAPPRFAEAWRAFCSRRAELAVHWRGMEPFKRKKISEGRELLNVLIKLMHWKDRDDRHLVRWVSSLVCGDSKALERRQKTLEMLLADATRGTAPTFKSLGILPVPPDVTFHGPLRLLVGGEWRDFRGMHGPTQISWADVERVSAVECDAAQCLTVENETPFRSLASLHSGVLLIHTSYPNEATLALLRHLALQRPDLEFWHFGDTDPAGFHILSDLRDRSHIPFRAFRMIYHSKPDSMELTRSDRDLLVKLIESMPAEKSQLEAMLHGGSKGDFEQESLQPPNMERWPFYG